MTIISNHLTAPTVFLHPAVDDVTRKTGGTMHCDALFERFLQEKHYLDGFTKKTIQFYEASYEAFKKAGLSELPADLPQCVITMRQGRMKLQTINTYSKGINPFFSWLAQNDYLTGFSKLKPSKPSVKSDHHNS